MRGLAVPGPLVGNAALAQLVLLHLTAFSGQQLAQVWSGRSLQEDFVAWADMRSCINVSGLCLEHVVLRAIMDISARAISLADRPQWAIWVTSARKRREDRSSISFLILSQTVRCFDDSLITRPESCSPRMLDREPGRSKQCRRACWRARW